MGNWTNDSEYEECVFDPYWIYALSVTFLGVTFNGILLVICLSVFHGYHPRRSTCKCVHRVHDCSVGNRDVFVDAHQQDTDYDIRPQFALNCFVSNYATAALIASCLRMVTSTYLFTLTYILCPSSLDDYLIANQAMQILLYLQHSVFNAAYVSFLIVLNLEKLLFIMKPLHYGTIMTRRRVVVVSVFTWILSSAWLPFYFAQNEEEAVRWGTILVTVLMIIPSVFCLITSAVLAVVVFRIQMQDRLYQPDNSNPHISRAQYWSYCKSLSRLFQSIVWTCVTSLPHPLAIIISYYAAVQDLSGHVVLRFFIGYLSIAYFSGTPFMIMWTYPVYWRRFKLSCT